MSKYMYTTVYEEFTGIKPPEPKEHKPKRKRGYGHPYRMRLNMQNNTTPASGNEKPQRHFNKESMDLESSNYNTSSDSYMVKPSRPRQEESHFSMSDTAPRVTYKKRRHVDHDACSHDAHF